MRPKIVPSKSNIGTPSGQRCLPGSVGLSACILVSRPLGFIQQPPSNAAVLLQRTAYSPLILYKKQIYFGKSCAELLHHHVATIFPWSLILTQRLLQSLSNHRQLRECVGCSFTGQFLKALLAQSQWIG